VLSTGIVKTPDDKTVAPDTFKDYLNVMHFQAWKGKPMHGQYVCNLHDN